MSKKYFTLNHLHDEASDSYSPNLHYTSYNSYDTISPQFSSGSPYHDIDSVSDKSKKIRKKRNTYQKINDETRKKLLDAVQQGDTLKAAAKRYGINYSSAKSILHTYRKEGRICKKSAQERTSRRRSKNSQDLEMSPIYLYKQCQEDFNGVQDTSTYQTYHSPEKSSEASEDEGPKAGVSGLAINSFGGFLKVGSQNQQTKVENLNSKSPGSTIVLKLESQRLQKVQNTETRNVYNGNWQLNVNVHNENQPPYKYIEEARNEVKSQNRPVSYGNFYMNCTNSPLSHVGRKKEEHVVGKDYENLTDVAAVMEESHVPFDGQSYDVSYFLNSSPAYAFQQQKVYGLEQYGNNENLSNMEHLRGIIDPHEMYYDGLNYRPKVEEGAAGLVKRAGLSSY